MIETQYINVGKSFGDYIKKTAIITLLIALIGIALYVSYAFSGVISGINALSFSSITIITLFHDVFVAAGLFIFCSLFFKEFQIDTFFVTALLTILGYSITDTIVIFDRIRTNLEKGVKHKQIDLKVIVDTSINEMLTRSIYTSLMLLIVLFGIFFFGPASLKGFILVMIFGTMVGTYSSIFIAAPLLYDINKNKELKVIVKKTYNPDSKIVV
jgi:preprotein translocase SecF subunit